MKNFNFSFGFFFSILHCLFYLSESIKQNFYIIQENESVSNITGFKKISGRSATACATICSMNSNCFLATYQTTTEECYLGLTGCSVEEPVQLPGWNIFHKTGKNWYIFLYIAQSHFEGIVNRFLKFLITLDIQNL